MFTVALQCLSFIIVYATLWFWIALFFERNDVADIAWGLGYVLLCLFILLRYDVGVLGKLVLALIMLWGLRLSIHIFLRNRSKTEDFRYKKWRQEWGKNFFLRSYLQVFLLQGFFLWVIISPAYILPSFPLNHLPMVSMVGIFLWLIGFMFQVVADAQLSTFKKNRNAVVLQTGIWKYSRHPNYFGEILMWWSIYIIILPIPNAVFFIVSPITITFLIMYVSGVPMLEKRYENVAEYQIYAQKTNQLFPWFPKKNKN
jgi:steroid 5-alpha reductase family enzyme